LNGREVRVNQSKRLVKNALFIEEEKTNLAYIPTQKKRAPQEDFLKTSSRMMSILLPPESTNGDECTCQTCKTFC
jgi:hypothetical protein